jgi:hypothetical protein
MSSIGGRPMAGLRSFSPALFECYELLGRVDVEGVAQVATLDRHDSRFAQEHRWLRVRRGGDEGREHLSLYQHWMPRPAVIGGTKRDGPRSSGGDQPTACAWREEGLVAQGHECRCDPRAKSRESRPQRRSLTTFPVRAVHDRHSAELYLSFNDGGFGTEHNQRQIAGTGRDQCVLE